MNAEQRKPVPPPYFEAGVGFGSEAHNLLAARLLRRIDTYRQQYRISQDQPIDTPRITANMLVDAENKLYDLKTIWGQRDLPTIFDPNHGQAQYDRLAVQGLTTLSENQARIAERALAGQDHGAETYRQFRDTALNKIIDAEKSGDLAKYLLWTYQLREYMGWRPIYPGTMETESIYRSVMDQPLPTVDDYVKEKEVNLKRYQVEARMAKRMVEMLDSLPDTDKIKIAILRTPAEIDSQRTPRVLTYFPTHSISLSDDPAYANDETKLEYTITDAPCIHHSFDSLYKATRKQLPNGEFTPRAFYVTSQTAENTDGIDNFPEAARRFLEISFADRTEIYPKTRQEIANTHPQVGFRENTTLLRGDVRQNIVNDGSLQHFILGYDEQGNKITQNLLPYAVDCLIGTTANSYNINVGQFFDKPNRKK